MMPVFLATRIVLQKLKFSELPEVLKAPVYEQLKDNGVEFLVDEEYPKKEDK